MLKQLMAMLFILLALGGLASAIPNECVDCYANIVTQNDIQSIDTVRLADEDSNLIDTVAVGNEGLTAGIIVTKEAVNPGVTDQLFVSAPFARIDQGMNQKVSHLGDTDPYGIGLGAKGITWNKAIQAAWVANQGVKELETVNERLVYKKEGSYVRQKTDQTITNILDYDSREDSKILNVDNKLAMIVHDVKAIIDLTAGANSSASDTQSSSGEITNGVNITIAGKDP